MVLLPEFIEPVKYLSSAMRGVFLGPRSGLWWSGVWRTVSLTSTPVLACRPSIGPAANIPASPRHHVRNGEVPSVATLTGPTTGQNRERCSTGPDPGTPEVECRPRRPTADRTGSGKG